MQGWVVLWISKLSFWCWLEYLLRNATLSISTISSKRPFRWIWSSLEKWLICATQNEAAELAIPITSRWSCILAEAKKKYAPQLYSSASSLLGRNLQFSWYHQMKPWHPSSLSGTFLLEFPISGLVLHKCKRQPEQTPVVIAPTRCTSFPLI